jgi:hypothetical protein
MNKKKTDNKTDNKQNKLSNKQKTSKTLSETSKTSKTLSSRNNSSSADDIIIDNDKAIEELIASRNNTPQEQKPEEQVFIIGKVKKTYLKESDILRALELNAGVLSETAKMLRTSYSRLKEFIDSNPSLKQAADDVLEVKKDLAESELNKHIKKGNLTAIIFFLKTRAKDRGYVESMDISLPNKPIYFVYKEVQPEVKK